VKEIFSNHFIKFSEKADDIGFKKVSDIKNRVVYDIKLMCLYSTDKSFPATKIKDSHSFHIHIAT
jgi:hypothetical protein